jgi:hypothetical protein
MSITNYSGGARDYLKKLIRAMGAEVTTTMTSATTHLIAARSVIKPLYFWRSQLIMQCLTYSKVGEKAARCDEWNIICVNHLYLEECFRAWRLLPPTAMDGRFLDFSPEVNYMALVGQASLSEESLRPWIGTSNSAPQNTQNQAEAHTQNPTQNQTQNLTQASAQIQSQRVKREPLGPIATSHGQQVGPPVVQPPALLASSSTQPVQPTIRTPRETRISAEGSRTPVPAAVATPTAKRRRLESAEPSHLRTPDARGLVMDNILAEGSRRSAAKSAEIKLHEDVMDANKFAKEKKRKHIMSPESRRKARMPLPAGRAGSALSDEGEKTPMRKQRRPASHREDTAEVEQGFALTNSKGRRAAPARTRTTASASVEPAGENFDQALKLSNVTRPKWLTTGVVVSDSQLKVRCGYFGTSLSCPRRTVPLHRQ